MESLNDTSVDGREDEHRQNAFDEVQTFSVEFNSLSLRVRSRLLDFEIVVNCTERLDRMTLRGRCPNLEDVLSWSDPPLSELGCSRRWWLRLVQVGDSKGIPVLLRHVKENNVAGHFNAGEKNA